MKSLLLCLIMFSSCLFMTKAEWQFSTVNINVSDSCKKAIHRLSELEVNDPQLMAYYWDSWGIPSDGIFTGHTTFLGYYDECIDLKNTALGETKYCIYSMKMETDISLSHVASPSKQICPSSKCSTPVKTSSVTDIKVGICYPSQCSSTEFAVVLSKMINFNITLMTTLFRSEANMYTIRLTSAKNSLTFCPDTNVEVDRGAIAVITVCVLLIGLVVVGTAMNFLLWPLSSNESPPKLSNKTEIVQTAVKIKDKNVNKCSSQHDQSIMKEFVLSFSLYNTVPKLVSTKQSTSTIKGLNAIKVFFNILIVVNHVYAFISILFLTVSQSTPQYFNAVFSRYIFQPIINITFSVDSFFLASATLSAYLTFKDMEKHKKFRCVYFYLKRYLRLSPMYYLFTFIAYKLSVHFGQGPIWFSQDYHTCKNSWWYNMFYLNNMLPVMDMCMLATWHICVDMQLFIFSPIFIVLLYHSLYYGLSAIALAVIAASITVGFVALKNSYLAAVLANPQVTDQINGLHTQSFYRVCTYLTGILLGYILYKKYNIATLFTSNWLKQLMYMGLWTIAVYLCTVPTLFGTYGEYSNTYHFTDFENITFLMFSGLAWSIGLAIIIYICNTGYGGVFDGFLSWPGWDPIARLTFGVFLIHQMVIFYIFGTLPSSLKYKDLVFVMISVFTLVISYSLSAVAALCVELPIANIISLCFKLARIETRSA